MDEVVVLALMVPIIWLIKTLVYRAVFRIRTIKATFLNCLLIAGAPFLLSIAPLPIPSFFSFLVAVGLAVYLNIQYTGVSLIPDGLFIPLGIESVFFIVRFVIRMSGVPV